MAMTLHRSFATAILSAALAFGGFSVATAHHGNPSEHSTTKGKSLSAIERRERQITAELNRRSLLLATRVAQAQITGQQPTSPTSGPR